MLYTGIISLQYCFVRMAHLYPQDNSFACKVLLVWYDLIDNMHIYVYIYICFVSNDIYDKVLMRLYNILNCLFNISKSLKIWPLLWMGKRRCWLCAFVFKDERVTWVKKLQTVREIDNDETKRIVVLHIEKILYFQVECLVLNVIIAWQFIPYIYSNGKTN